jgi:hypothetical protein
MDTCHEQTFHVSLTHASLTHACGWIEKARLRSVTVYDQQNHLMEVSGLKNLGFIEIRKDAAHPVVWPRKKETPRHARNANPANNRSAHPNQLPIQSTSEFQHYKVVCAHASSLPVPLSLSLSLSLSHTHIIYQAIITANATAAMSATALALATEPAPRASAPQQGRSYSTPFICAATWKTDPGAGEPRL